MLSCELARRNVSPLGLTLYSCEPDEAELFRELSPPFGVAPTITSAAVSRTNASAAAGNRCISVGHKSEISARELGALKEAGVEYISTRSIGVDHIDVTTAAELGIAVEGVGYAPDGVADFTVMQILMVVRRAKQYLGSAERHDFRVSGPRGRDLRDMTVGVVGAGPIGQAVITRLHGFGCRVLASNSGREAATTAELVSLGVLLKECDVVTLHAPLTVGTRHLIGAKEIDKMKSGAILINTARGALVDTAAVVAGLESGQVGGAALDVLEGEEGIFYVDHSTRPIDHPLLRRLQELPNVVVTPHTAYFTERTLRETVEGTLMNCHRFERRRANVETNSCDSVRRMLGRA